MMAPTSSPDTSAGGALCAALPMPMMKRPRQLAVSAALAKSNACVARRTRQRLQSDPHRQHAERDVDRKQPRPRTERQDGRGDRRPECEGGAHHQRVMAKTTAEHMGRVDEANQRRIHAHDAAGTKPLQRPRGQKTGQRPRQGAAERSQREQQKSANIDALMADDFAERAERQQRRDQRDLIDIDDPDHVRRADMEVGGNRGQRDVGDRRIQ
jgi:hypothetical protein